MLKAVYSFESPQYFISQTFQESSNPCLEDRLSRMNSILSSGLLQQSLDLPRKALLGLKCRSHLNRHIISHLNLVESRINYKTFTLPQYLCDFLPFTVPSHNSREENLLFHPPHLLVCLFLQTVAL